MDTLVTLVIALTMGLGLVALGLGGFVLAPASRHPPKRHYDRELDRHGPGKGFGAARTESAFKIPIHLL